MSSPGDSGPRTDRRTGQPSGRREHDDASVTASLPAVSADRAESGSAASPYPHGAMPGAESRDAWKGPSGSPGPAMSKGSTGSGPSNRTEVVPSVAGVPAAAGVGAAAGSARPSFGDNLPPRPGAAVGGRGAATATATPVRRPARESAAKPARRAQLTLRRFNVWSVFKFSCMLAIALWLVWMIAIGVLYGILDGAGVVGSLNDVYAQLQGSDSGALVRPGQVLGIAAIIGVVNIVLFIALSSLFAVIYNLVSDFVGGVEVTLSERE